MKLKSYSMSGNYIQLISVVSGAIAALAALVAIFLTFRSQKLDREAKRPYFVIEAPGFKKIEQGLRLQITFINKGIYPAKDFKGEIRIFKKDLTKEIKIDVDVVNDIPANSPTPYYNDGVVLGPNMPLHFVYCHISYYDPILEKKFNQEFYMKWNGTSNGLAEPDFVQINKDEKLIVDKYVKTMTDKR